jgi:hypothetical protein
MYGNFYKYINDADIIRKIKSNTIDEFKRTTLQKLEECRLKRDEFISRGTTLRDSVVGTLTALCAINGTTNKQIFDELLTLFGFKFIDFEHLKNTGEIVNSVTVFSIDKK